MNGDIPVITPTYVGYAPRPDGKVSDQTWATARRVGDFRLVGSGDLASQRTDVRVCYDRATLYLAFECFEDQMDKLVSVYGNDGDPVWQDDSVEVYISPYCVADGAKCHQFVVNAAGAKTYLRPDWVRRDEGWRAAVVRLTDRWVAEIAIPFESVRPLGRNESCWRINLGRNECPHGESSSWSAVPHYFATCSRFGRLIPPDAPFEFTTYRGPAACLEASPAAPTGCRPVTELPRKLRSDCIIPEPQEVHVRVTKDAFRINSQTRIVIGDDASEQDMWTVDEINSVIERLGGRPLDTVHSSALGQAPKWALNCIVIGENARNKLLRSVCERDAVRIPRSRFGAGAHVIDVLAERIAIAGSSPLDTFHGAQTLKQLLKTDADGIYVSAISIRDYARFRFRGVHLLTSRDGLSYITNLIENVLAPLKINHIVLQTDKIAWAGHPELTDKDNSMPREDIPKLLEVARRHHITVTPLVQSPGHLEWAFRDGNNSDIVEDPGRPYCYCMSNPKSYEFIFSIMDEAIEIFGHPEYLHAGRDEFDVLGAVPCDDRCRAVGKQKLYIQDTLRIYEHLKSRGCKMMMWGDVLTKIGYREMIDELPKDILINDWRYQPSIEYPSTEFYQTHGFSVIAGTWYDPRNIFTFANYAARRGIQGMLQTTWTGWKTEQETLRDHPEQVYAYVLGAGWAWNPVRPALDSLPYRPDAVFGNLWHGAEGKTGSVFSTVNLARYCNISRTDSGRSIGWLGNGRGNDLRAIPEGLVDMEGTPFVILPGKLDAPSAVMLRGSAVTPAFPSRVDGIEVNTKLSALSFLHGCAFSADEGADVGSYVIHYEDGGSETIDLIYGKRIFAWDDQLTAMSYGFAWRGRAPDGRLVGVGDLRWTNPRPEVRVTTLDFIGGDTEASPFLLAITAEHTAGSPD